MKGLMVYYAMSPLYQKQGLQDIFTRWQVHFGTNSYFCFCTFTFLFAVRRPPSAR
jgi:hypothetical protein